jgi:hypothetical protein
VYKEEKKDIKQKKKIRKTKETINQSIFTEICKYFIPAKYEFTN